MGTLTRSDDKMADFSSSGPTAVDFEAKPDLVAPGVGTVSLAVPGSTFYIEKVTSLLDGTLGARFEAVPGAERHEHGGAGRHRHGRADAAGQSEPDAELDQGVAAIHRAGLSGLQPAS